MGTAVQSAFDYDDLERGDAEFLREKTGEIRQLARVASESIMLIGGALIEVKERIGHGYFMPWLETEFHWTDRTALRFMQVAQAFKSDNLSDLQIDASALYLLAAPSTPEPVRQAVIERAQQGERISHAVAKEAVREFSPKLEKAMASYVAKHTAPPPPPMAPKPDIAPVVPLESRPQFLKLTEAESDWRVDLRDALDFIDSAPFSLDRSVVLAKDFGISRARIQKAIAYLQRLEAGYES